jgi:hypothetical protein
LLVVTKLKKMPVDRVEGTGFTSRVASGVVESQRLIGLDHGFQDAILRLQDVGTAKTGQRTKTTVTKPPGQFDSLVQMMTGADDIAEQEPEPAKVLAGCRQSGEVI